MSQHEYTFVDTPDKARHVAITERLRAFNLSNLPSDGEHQPLETYVLDRAGTVVAGLVGRTVWGWLEVGELWVDESRRGRGLGRELMARAEAEARRRGCVAARLSTWDFQALGFYERLGYRPYGRLDDYPAGRTVHYLRKDLAAHPHVVADRGFEPGYCAIAADTEREQEAREWIEAAPDDALE